MVEFTRDELLQICNWAMAEADRYYKMHLISYYEEARSIFVKANNEYAKMIEG